MGRHRKEYSLSSALAARLQTCRHVSFTTRQSEQPLSASTAPCTASGTPPGASSPISHPPPLHPLSSWGSPHTPRSISSASFVELFSCTPSTPLTKTALLPSARPGEGESVWVTPVNTGATQALVGKTKTEQKSRRLVVSSSASPPPLKKFGVALPKFYWWCLCWFFLDKHLPEKYPLAARLDHSI